MAAAVFPPQPLFFFLLTISSSLISSSAVLNPRFEELAQAEFNYLGGSNGKGPEKWGELSPEYTSCSHGKSQSPIDITTSEAVLNRNFKPLERQYCPANASLVNNAFNVGMKFEGYAGALILKGKNYSLAQMHWHTPSEHRLNGVRYDAELHIVNKADDGALSVVAMLYKYGKPDPLLEKMQSKLSQLGNEVHGTAPDAHPHVPLGIVNIKQIRMRTNKYYRYTGSLTTPPCTENVIWSVLGKVRSISKEQVEDLKAQLDLAYKNNSRPVQPLNGRQVEMFDIKQLNL